jgi:UPF0716 protein FxsA
MTALVLILWPLAEIAAAIAVGHVIGLWLTLLLLVLGWPVGTWLLRTEGRSAQRRLREALNAGRAPGREVIDGLLVLAGGLLLIIPGFITDALGLALLAPPLRRPLHGVVSRNLAGRLIARVAGFGRGPRGGAPRGGGHGYDVDSTAHDIDQPQLHG